MSLSLSFHVEAMSDLVESAQWYESERVGLGVELRAAARTAVSEIEDWPHLAPVFPGWNEEPVIRMKAVKRFPYHVLYYRTATEVRIVAFAHDSRSPGYWRHRI